MKLPIFTGSGVALVTPFTSTGVDFPALKKLVDFQINNGTDAIIVCGTTGEAATMTQAERIQTIETVVEHVNGRAPVIAGSGANNTETAVQASREIAKIGVDALLVVTPYYNKATPRGLIRHYTAVADAVRKPVILYNVPPRTGVRCTAEVYAALAKHPNIIGVKEASSDLALVQRTRRMCPENFYIWSGDDAETATIMLLGGKGVISVAANIVPRQMHQLTADCLSGNFAAAGAMQVRLSKLMEALFWEVNPIPVKTALAMMGYCQEILRLPMCEMEPENRYRLQTVLKEFALLP